MVSTLHHQFHSLVKNGRLFEKKINRGDVIVFIPEGDNKNFIKRVLALPGEQIQIVKGKPVVNGVEATSKFITTEILSNSSGEELTAENGMSHLVKI